MSVNNSLSNNMALIKSSSDSLSQVELIVNLSNEFYCNNGNVPSAPIGKHVRHVLDHFFVLKNGLVNGDYNYNHRRRDNAVEQSASVALNEIDELREWLNDISLELHEAHRDNALETNALMEPIKITSEVDFDEEKNVAMASSFFREMLYVINHTIHHVAFMTLVLRVHGIHVPENIGLASATASYERKQAQYA